MARSIFRIAEYIGGWDGYLLRHDWATYTFDSIFMFMVQLILAVWFLGVFNTVINGTTLHRASGRNERSQVTVKDRTRAQVYVLVPGAIPLRLSWKCAHLMTQ